MAQAQAQTVVTALTDATSTNELGALADAMINNIRDNVAKIQALGAAIGSNQAAADSVIEGISAGTIGNLGNAMAGDATIQNAISQGITASLQPGAPITTAITNALAAVAPGGAAAHAVVAGQLNGRVPCGTPATIGDGQTRVVRAGFCFPDEHNECNGSILVDPTNPAKEISTRDIFKRDSLFVNFAAAGDTLSRDLDGLVDISNAGNLGLFLAENNGINANTFNYREFFMVDTSSKNIIANRLTRINLVKLRYAVGPIGSYYTHGPVPSLKGRNNLTELERVQISAGIRTIGTWSLDKNWTICPAFFTYRMLPLKTGFMTAYGYNRLNKLTGPRRRVKCIGVHPPGTEVVNDVYLYTFVDQNGDAVTRNTAINKKIRREDISFNSGDLPYENDFFKFPVGFEETVVTARFPDGILLFSYNGNLTPIAPLGTVVDKAKLHTVRTDRRGYPDQPSHTQIMTALETEMAAVQTNMVTLNGMMIRLYSGAGVRLDSPAAAAMKEIIIGGIGYITMMKRIKQTLVEESDIVFGGRHRFMTRGRRRNNKSVKRNIMKSKSKGMTKSKGRGTARAASMLKSAKQRFYKAGGMGMGLGFGPSVPQPLQRISPLVSQASRVRV